MSARLPSLDRLTPRAIAARIFAFLSLAFLAACDLPGLSGDNSGQQINPGTPVEVALLVPGGSGNSDMSAIAASLENAARLAVADLNGAQINLRVYNTGRDPARAAQMTAQALSEGAQIILGPLEAASANAAGLAAAPANVNVLAFSNNPTIAGGNVFILGNTFQNTSNRLVGYANAQGVSRYMIVHQNDPAGVFGRDAIATSIRAAGAEITSIEAYPFTQQGIFDRAPAIAAAASTNRAQAVFVTDTVAGGLPILATALVDRGLNPAASPLVGITRWDAAPQTAELPAFQNGMFATPDAGREAAFRDRYRAAYGQAPHALASLAYDGIAAIGALAATGDRDALTARGLTRSSGFAGATGVWRLLPNGQNERALAVARVSNGQITIIDPAPLAFGRGGS